MNNCLSLDVKQKKIYNVVFDAVSKDKTEFIINTSEKMASVLCIIKIVLGEHAEYFYYDNCSIQYSEFGTQKTIRLNKWVSGFKFAMYNDKFKRESQNIINNTITSQMNKMQKVLAIHNYLIKNVTYYSGYSNILNYQHYHTAYGAIVEKNAVCEGISAAFSYLLSLVGINSTVVNGSSDRFKRNDHCWNIVNIDDEYYHFDVTWDLNNKNSNISNCFDYFGMKDSDLNRRTWNKSLYKSCNSNKMNFFYLTKSVAKDETDFVEIGLRQCRNSNDIYVKCLFAENLKNEDEVCNCIFRIISNNYKLSQYFRKGVKCSVNIDQSIVHVTGNN